jgi:dTDP-4-amino-4,6-dideoxygalactose transaminase
MERLAIMGGKPAITTGFPGWPVWDATDEQAVAAAVGEGVWGIGGSKIDEFAKKFAEFQHLKHVIPVSNGSVAIDVALQAIGVGPGDEVIVPDYTFMATALSPLRNGAKLVLVDVDPSTFCLDPEAMNAAFTAKTKAVIAVHLGGHPCDMPRIVELARKHGMYVIEDCAHAHGAILDGTYVGSFGDICTFSFQSSKTLAAGEGGAVGTNSDRLAALCWSYHNCGRVPNEPDYNHYLAGTNYRMGNLQAALLCAQIDRLEAQCGVRDENGKYLTQLLSEIDLITPQARAAKVDRNGHYLFIFLVDDSIPRDAFRGALEAEGVPTQLEYPTIHSLDFVRKAGAAEGTFPNSSMVAQRSVWLYHRALLGGRMQTEAIASAVRKVVQSRDELKTLPESKVAVGDR